MGRWIDAYWDPDPGAQTRDARRGGRYRTYLPDLMSDRPVRLDDVLSRRLADVEGKVRGVQGLPGSHGTEGLARFLLRSEAIASSRIEGLRVSPRQLGLAEVVAEEQLPAARVGESARLVVANVAAIRRATTAVAVADAVSVQEIVALHRLLVADRPDIQGLRTAQNWIGGSEHHPLSAEFVPPGPDFVRDLTQDLAAYASGGTYSALLQAALVHAQFETIHPFADGNGRVGRALIHAVLVRRGLTRTAVLPISPVMLTWSEGYVRGLTRYRHEGSPDSPDAQEAVADWVTFFLDAVEAAVALAQRFAEDLHELRVGWQDSLARSRSAVGLRGVPRSGSAVARLLELLHEAPVLTASAAARHLGTSDVSARQALDELAGAGILRRHRIAGQVTAYLAEDVLDLLAVTERRMASTRWDTATTPPGRPAPDRPPARGV